MDKQLQIILECPDKLKVGHFKEIYRNTVVVDDSLSIPFEGLIKSLKFLYPRPDLIIHFRLSR